MLITYCCPLDVLLKPTEQTYQVTMRKSLLTATRPLPEPPVVPVLVAVPAGRIGLSHHLSKGAQAHRPHRLSAYEHTECLTIGSGSIPAEGMLVNGFGMRRQRAAQQGITCIVSICGHISRRISIVVHIVVIVVGGSCLCGLRRGLRGGLGGGEGL